MRLTVTMWSRMTKSVFVQLVNSLLKRAVGGADVHDGFIWKPPLLLVFPIKYNSFGEALRSR